MALERIKKGIGPQEKVEQPFTEDEKRIFKSEEQEPRVPETPEEHGALRAALINSGSPYADRLARMAKRTAHGNERRAGNDD